MQKLNTYLMAFLLMFVSVSYGLTASEVYKLASRSIYPVFGYDSKEEVKKSAGTGVAVSAEMLATNCHIVQDADKFMVKIHHQLKQAKLIYQDFNHDLCFLEVQSEIFTPVVFRETSTVEIGEEVYAIGNPHGLEKTISRGIISNKHKFLGASLLQTDATISFGSSGGGLFDKQGKLIGITRAGHRFKDISFAVPSDWILNALNAAQTTKLAIGINRKITENMASQYEEIHATPETVGNYGKDAIGLYRYKNHCFIALQGKRTEKDQGVLIWYPHNPMVIYFAPYVENVGKAFGQLLKYGHISQLTGDVSLETTEVSSSLPAILQTSDVVAKRFDSSPQKQFESGHQIFLHFPDVYKNFEEDTITFGLLGFKKAYKSYAELCGE